MEGKIDLELLLLLSMDGHIALVDLTCSTSRTGQTERREEPTSTSAAAGLNQTEKGEHLDLELLDDDAVEVGIQVVEALDGGELGG